MGGELSDFERRIAEELELRQLPDETNEEFRFRLGINHVMDEGDPFIAAELMTGKTEGKEYIAVGYTLMKAKADMASREAQENNDIYSGIPWHDFLSIINELGFEQQDQVDFETKNYGVRTFGLWTEPKRGLVLTADSGLGWPSREKTLNGGELHFQVVVDENAGELERMVFWDTIMNTTNSPLLADENDIDSAYLGRGVIYHVGHNPLKKFIKKLDDSGLRTFNPWVKFSQHPLFGHINDDSVYECYRYLQYDTEHKIKTIRKLPEEVKKIIGYTNQ